MGMSTEVADQIGSQSIWSPFAVSDITIGMDVEAVFFIASAEFLQASFGLFDFLDPILSSTETVTKSVFERREPRIQPNNSFGRSA